MPRPRVNIMPPKVFGIGLPKTGTLSLAKALEQLGYRTLHHAAYLGICAALNRARGERLLAVADEQFDALVDGPLLDLYPELDRQYPGSRFVWTTRERGAWLVSTLRHVRGLHAAGELPLDAASWLARYEEHSAGVAAYFAGRSDCLRLDVCSGDAWPPLCRFLGQAVPASPFPHANRATVQA